MNDVYEAIKYAKKYLEVSHHFPGEVLKNFKENQNLRIELTSGELGIEEGVLWKWKTEFGNTLQSCEILGAASLVKGTEVEKKGSKSDGSNKPGCLQVRTDGSRIGESLIRMQPYDSRSIHAYFFTDEGMKLRVVWTISSLSGASTRHYLLQHIIFDHPTLESLVFTDADGQGMLCISKEQLTQVPALNVKLCILAKQRRYLLEMNSF
ncbi:hypothetical protein MPTK1_5g08320 [Marchantia polymorpha subsp. ruderalis]|uniref:Uncharacterized protein n=2 Tax=Marchantia polymorpha TaxID=3197 RepID=A0AAF6BG77_MARPO|nr:hypothetical protein MARPO_0086s0036 [Marchantia polymorpha]BBN11011.1 hypothetical protein Mp_5g08320 [Marchantia polymorpha subsp. ruderalis]|eukprot:PTQ33709.1 hypothetical protein MARPO_0086s0036 [Marchantia polymorpha]